jgi:hypothetical protein
MQQQNSADSGQNTYSDATVAAAAASCLVVAGSALAMKALSRASLTCTVSTLATVDACRSAGATEDSGSVRFRDAIWHRAQKSTR